MVIEVCVEEQSLRWYDHPPRIADKSIQFVYFHFNLSPDWDGYEVTAQFDQGNVYNKLVTDGCCDLPNEIQEGQCTVSLFGYKAGQACRATAIPLRFDIFASGFSSEAEPPIPPDPDLYAQLLAKINDAVANAAPQLQAMIGDLDKLDTTAKENLVAAINEALTKGGGSVDEAEIQRIVDEYLTANPPTETDPTVPAWAKQPSKPTYTAKEVGALPDTYNPPDQTAQQVGADPAGTAASAVSQHNTDTAAHNDLRLALKDLADRVNAALDSDDTTLDQMSEVVAYIKSNKSLIDAITTSKVSVADIVNDLVTNVADKPLSAAQGVALKGLIEELRALIPEAYTLPTATETTLGGVKPVTATGAMTQPVGVTADGRLVTKPGEGGSGIAVTGATVGQTVKISAVDENGVPTAWEPVDLPSGGGGDLQWYKVAETETTEEITEYVVSQDFDGNPIKSYNPVAIALYFATPADSTQASTNGSPWIYPSASSKNNYIRAIGTIAGWKTTERTNTEVFFGSEHGLIGLGNANPSSMIPVGLESSIMDGVSIMFNTRGDHFPIGTHFIVSVLGARP